MAASSLFSGEVCRNWRFADGDGVSHEVSLYHHPLTGARAAMVDHEELPGSLGTSSVFHGSTTSMPFCAGKARGSLHIIKDKMLGFSYSCVVDGKSLPEATAERRTEGGGVGSSSSQKTEDPLFTARVVNYETSRDHAQPTMAIAWYLVSVTSVATGREATRVHRRFRDFADLDETVQAAFAGHHMRSSMPTLPSKKLKFVQDHLEPAFLEQRRAELDAYVERLCRVPHVWATPGMEPFFGVAANAREYSVIFKARTLGFTVGKCGPKKSPEAGDSTYEPPDFPAFVANASDGLEAVKVGDLVSKISGKATCNWLFKAVVNAVKDSPRPLVVHFVGAHLGGTTVLLKTAKNVKQTTIPVVTATPPSRPPPRAPDDYPARPPPAVPDYDAPTRQPPRPPPDLDEHALFDAPPSRPPPVLHQGRGDDDDDDTKTEDDQNPFADADDITTL